MAFMRLFFCTNNQRHLLHFEASCETRRDPTCVGISNFTFFRFVFPPPWESIGSKIVRQSAISQSAFRNVESHAKTEANHANILPDEYGCATVAKAFRPHYARF